MLRYRGRGVLSDIPAITPSSFALHIDYTTLHLLRPIERRSTLAWILSVGWPVPALRQRERFFAVAEKRHFGCAAQICNVSQRSLCHQLRGLQNRLGAVLIVNLRALSSL